MADLSIPTCLCLIYISFFLLFDRLPPTYTIRFVDGVKVTEERLEVVVDPPSQSQPFPARLLSNCRLTHPEHFQEVRLLEFDISNSNIQ